MLTDTIKERIVTAVKNKNIPERDILKYLLGEVQTLESRQNKNLQDEQVESIIRKIIANNDEVLKIEAQDKLLKENEILKEFLPTVLTQEQIKSWLLDNSKISEAKNVGQAMGMAMKAFKSSGQKVLGDDVKSVVGELVA